MNLSVIIPIYNTPQHLLEHCLASIQENLMEMDDVEVLMINDGSTAPHIAPLLSKKARQDSRFQYICKTNSGVSNTRNMGIELAQGEYIMFVDADDYLEPKALQYMLTTARREQADMAMFGFCHDDKPIVAEPVRRWIDVDAEVMRTLFSNDMSSWYSKAFNLAAVWAKLYKRDIILQNHVFFIQDIAPNEDGYFNLCLLNSLSTIYVDNTLVYHYVTFEESAIHKFSNHDFRVAKNLLPRLEKFATIHSPNKTIFISAICSRTLQLIRSFKSLYFTHPQNTKSFGELKREMDDFLSTPVIRKYIRKMRLKDAKDKIELKNIILLKLHLYWIFLLTERRKRLKKTPHSN